MTTVGMKASKISQMFTKFFNLGNLDYGQISLDNVSRICGRSQYNEETVEGCA